MPIIDKLLGVDGLTTNMWITGLDRFKAAYKILHYNSCTYHRFLRALKRYLNLICFFLFYKIITIIFLYHPHEIHRDDYNTNYALFVFSLEINLLYIIYKY